MEKIKLKKMINAAKNAAPDFVLKNANVVNVFTDEIINCDVALYGETIIGLGKYDCKNSYDCGGKFLCPGFIDSHVHIESSMSCPPEFAKLVLPFGTTTVIADPHEIANVCGTAGIRFMQRYSKNIGLDVHYMFPSCVPSNDFEENNSPLSVEDAAMLLYEKDVFGLGELMDSPGVINCEKGMIEKLRLFDGLPIDGHAPGLSGNELNAYIIAGPKTDHEAYEYDEIIEKLRAGMTIQLRVGSAANNIESAMEKIAKNRVPTDNMVFCTDDKHTENILIEGHINHIARLAVKAGISPVDAVKMASYNAAKAYGLNRKGAIAPGYDGDLVLFEDLEEFIPIDVFVMGRNIKDIGISGVAKAEKLTETVNFAPFDKEDIKLKVKGKMPVMEMEAGQLYTKLHYDEVPNKNGEFAADGEYCKIISVERHHATGHMGVGIVKYFGLSEGAVASTVSHDSHNLVVIGKNDDDIIAAAKALQDIGGGYAAVKDGRVLAAIPLPIGGILSSAPYEQLVQKQAEFLKILSALGITRESDPLIRMSFFCLPVIPEVRITTKGMYDVLNNKFI